MYYIRTNFAKCCDIELAVDGNLASAYGLTGAILVNLKYDHQFKVNLFFGIPYQGLGTVRLYDFASKPTFLANARVVFVVFMVV